MNRKLLVVEERHSPMLQRNSRGGERREALATNSWRTFKQPSFCAALAGRVFF